MNHAASLKIDILVWKKCLLFLGKHEKKTSSVKRHCGALCFQNKCFLLFICFFITVFTFFFLSTFTASQRGYLAAYIDRWSKNVEDFKIQRSSVSTIFQTSPNPLPPTPPPLPRHYKVHNLFNVRLICKPKCEMRQVTCKILCYLFGFIRNEARQSLIISQTFMYK